MDDSITPPAASPATPAFDTAFRGQLHDLFRWRRDVRRFCVTPIAEHVIAGLFELACLAPSVGFSQPWRFVTVASAERRAAVRADYTRCNAAALAVQGERAGEYARLKLAGLDEAPCQFAVFAEPHPAAGHGLGRRTMPETTTYSAVMAVHTLWLAARAIGLGLGWVSILEPAFIARVLDIPSHWVLVGYFCLGYPAAEFDTPELEREGWEQRRPAADLVLKR